MFIWSRNSNPTPGNRLILATTLEEAKIIEEEVNQKAGIKTNRVILLVNQEKDAKAGNQILVATSDVIHNSDDKRKLLKTMQQVYDEQPGNMNSGEPPQPSSTNQEVLEVDK